MKARVERAEFLRRLEAVQPGLSARDILEQSSCFVFRRGRVITFNDEVACRTPSSLPEEFTGAVAAKSLLSSLRKSPDEVVEVGTRDGYFVVRGKGGRETGVRMDAKITLPVQSVEAPQKEDWRKLSQDFNDALAIVQESAGRDESQFALTCVHVHPRWLEACDNYQLTRYRLKTGVDKEFLIKREAIRSVSGLDMTHFAETENWVHFRNPAGLVLSCRRHLDEYPDLTTFLEVEGGSPATLPKGLAEAADRCQDFSSENADDDQLIVELTRGRLMLQGLGVSGYHKEPKKIQYSGEDLAFKIGPKMLIEISKRHNEVEISSERLRVNGGRWVFVSCLGKPGEGAEVVEEGGEDE